MIERHLLQLVLVGSEIIGQHIDVSPIVLGTRNALAVTERVDELEIQRGLAAQRESL